MIDRPSRDKLATALRQYVSGRITNDDLDEIEVDLRDRGAVAVKECAWFLYDDTHQHKAVGIHYLARPERDEIGRWILFLHSDLEYTWPELSFIQVLNLPLYILTLGLWGMYQKKRFDEFRAAGDYSVWPFIARQDYDEALRNPRYMSGALEK